MSCMQSAHTLYPAQYADYRNLKLHETLLFEK